MKKLNIMAIGAHPDDCDFRFGGTALKFTAAGHRVRFLSMTNGSMGHQSNPGTAMAARRYGEAQAAAKLAGLEYRILDIADGSLTTELRYRLMLLEEIRNFKPDIIITHRPNDYHPDHRYTGTLVMDCSYMVIVPGIKTESPAPRKAPYIFYLFDTFTSPEPFTPHIVVGIDDVMDKKTALLNCHASQVYEWLPYAGEYSAEVPPEKDEKARLAWLKGYLHKRHSQAADLYRERLVKRYGKEKGAAIKECEAFQLCEYGRWEDVKKLEKFFPL